MLAGPFRLLGNFIRGPLQIDNAFVQDTAYVLSDAAKSVVQIGTRRKGVPKGFQYAGAAFVTALMGGMMISTTHEGKGALGVKKTAEGKATALGRFMTGWGRLAEDGDGHAQAVKTFMFFSFGAALLSTQRWAKTTVLTGEGWRKINVGLKKIGMADEPSADVAKVGDDQIRVSKVGSLVAALFGMAAGLSQSLPNLFFTTKAEQAEDAKDGAKARGTGTVGMPATAGAY